MCEVKLSVCERCSRVYEAQLDHCEALFRHLESCDPEPFPIKSQFCWSAGTPCDGLRVCSRANLGRCDRHQAADGPGSLFRLAQELVLAAEMAQWRTPGPERESPRSPASA